MKSKLGHFYNDFLRYPVEHRFLVLIPWFASILTGVSAIEGLFLNDPFFVIFCSLSTLVFVVTWFMMKAMKDIRIIAWIMVINTLVLTNVVWFRFEGSKGTSPALFLMLFVCLAVFFKNIERIVAISIILVNLLVLIYFEYAFPHLINIYGSPIIRMIDLFITYSVCGIFVVFVIHGILRSYLSEKVKAEQVEKLKSAFLLNISHEFRTPMNAIIGFSNLITQADVSRKDRIMYSRFISDACKSLINMVDEIIEVAEIESNQCDIQKVKCIITDILKDIYFYFNDAPDKSIRKEVSFYLNESSVEKEVIIETDPALIKRVLRNLVDNSIKFTHNGFIEVGYSVRYSDILFM